MFTAVLMSSGMLGMSSVYPLDPFTSSTYLLAPLASGKTVNAIDAIDAID